MIVLILKLNHHSLTFINIYNIFILYIIFHYYCIFMILFDINKKMMVLKGLVLFFYKYIY